MKRNSTENFINASSIEIQYNDDEQKLLQKFVEEYNDIFQRILLLSQEEFFSSLIERVEISDKLKNENNHKSLYPKIKERIYKTLYRYDYKCASIVKSTLLGKSKTEISQYLFTGKIIPHCDFDKNKNGYYTHSCGEKFYFIKYKKSANENEKMETLIYCMRCDMIYKSSMIKFKCNKTGNDFYSKLINNNNENECLATWKKYHCNAIINDCMKCQQCNKNLYFSPKKNIVYCKNCNNNFNPLDKKWKCVICQKEFITDVKIYNPLEYKSLKICVKDAKINKIPAKPQKMECECGYKINDRDYFFHKINCRGNLYLGEISNQEVVICEKCSSVGIYESYIWTCPQCLKRFKNNYKEKDEKTININNNNNSHEFDNITIENQTKNYINANKSFSKINTSICKKTKTKKYISLKGSRLIKSNKLSNNKRTSSSLNLNGFNQIYLNSTDNYDCGNSRTNIENCSLKNLEQLKDIFKKNKVSDFHNESSFNINYNQVFKPKKANLKNLKRINSFQSKQLINSKGFIKNYKNFAKSQNLNKNESNNNVLKIKKSVIFNRSKDNTIDEDDDINQSIMKTSNNFHKMKLNKICLCVGKIKSRVQLSDTCLNKFKFTDVNKNNSYKKVSSFKEKDNLSENKNQFHAPAIKSININLNIHKNNTSGNFYKTEYKNSNKNLMSKDGAQKMKKIGDLSSILMKNIFSKKNNNVNFNTINANQTVGNNTNNNIINFHINYFNSIFDKNNNNKLEDLLSSQRNYFDVDNYKIIRQIGKGTFGQIFLAEGVNHELYALKKIITANFRDIQSIEHEYQLLIDINTVNNKLNLVKIHGIQTKILDPTTYVIYILMDLANGDWEKEILNRQKMKIYYNEKELMNIIYNLVSTLAELQRQNISHRDIKPQNILIFEDKFQNKSYKLTDFGEAKELINNDKPTDRQTLRGTELYMSPILFKALRGKQVIKYIQHNTYKSDLFSFGLCCLFAASLTFDSLYDVREIDNNKNIKKIIYGYLHKNYSDSFIDIICCMLEVEEDNRKDFIEIEKEFKKFWK